MKKPQNDVISTQMAAERLGFSASYIRRMILGGKLSARKIGHDWIILEKDIVKFLAQHKEKAHGSGH